MRREMQKLEGQRTTHDGFDGELLALLLDEAERALLLVEARADEPGRRLVDGGTHEVAADAVAELRLAVAELVDAHPSVSFDLELIGDRVRSLGVHAGVGELESRPELLDLVRLSLEAFFLHHPTADVYEAERRADDGGAAGVGDDGFEDAHGEAYLRFGKLLGLLRARIS